MMYVIFTEQSPFRASLGLNALIKDKLQGHFPEPKSAAKKLDPDINRIILKAMASKTENRFRSMNELRDEIKKKIEHPRAKNYAMRLWDKITSATK
jgi:hypothetical protein